MKLPTILVIMTHYVNMQQFIRPHCTKQLITQCRFVQLLQWQPECKIVIYVITCFYSNISNEVDIVSEALSFQELVSHARWRLSKALLVCDQITKDGIGKPIWSDKAYYLLITRACIHFKDIHI